jgi:hypothetical protein
MSRISSGCSGRVIERPIADGEPDPSRPLDRNVGEAGVLELGGNHAVCGKAVESGERDLGDVPLALTHRVCGHEADLLLHLIVVFYGFIGQ